MTEVDVQDLMDRLHGWKENTKMKMSRMEFLSRVATLYRMGNLADHETNPNRDWTRPSMASHVCCALDKMMNNLLIDNIITDEEHRNFYEDL